MTSTLIWSIKNRPDEVIKYIKTADNTASPTTKFLIVDAASESENLARIKYAISKIERPIKIIESYKCMSLPQAWNLGIMLSDTEHVIFASSDVVFTKSGWNESLNNALKAMPYVLIDNHSVFGLDVKTMISKVGWFDENFKSGPHFDPDYMIRASEAGLQIGSIVNFYYTHGDDDSTKLERLTSEVKDRLPMNDFSNEEYFMKKWGSGWPGWKQAIANKELHMPHPPTHISQVTRKIPEVNFHPSYT